MQRLEADLLGRLRKYEHALSERGVENATIRHQLEQTQKKLDDLAREMDENHIATQHNLEIFFDKINELKKRLDKQKDRTKK